MNTPSAEENNLPNLNNESPAHSSAGEHEASLSAEPIFKIANFPVTNSILTSWLALILILILSLAIKFKLRKIPGVLQGIMEKIVEEGLKLLDLVTNDRRKSQKILPVIFAIFIFILVNNWLGLLPGIGSLTLHGKSLLRGGTADLNTTLTLGIFAVVLANVAGAMSVGPWNYFNKFVNLKSLSEVPKKIWREPTIILVNPIKFFVGLIEIISEFAKVASLSFRLFGNIFAGEILLGSISAMVAYVVPLPFMFLEILVGVIQALIFSVLTAVYYAMATEKYEGH